MTYNVFGGTLNLAQLNSTCTTYECPRFVHCVVVMLNRSDMNSTIRHSRCQR